MLEREGVQTPAVTQKCVNLRPSRAMRLRFGVRWIFEPKGSMSPLPRLSQKMTMKLGFSISAARAAPHLFYDISL